MEVLFWRESTQRTVWQWFVNLFHIFGWERRKFWSCRGISGRSSQRSCGGQFRLKLYLAGVTSSTNFPTTASAYRAVIPPAGNTNDAAFVTVLDTTKSGVNSLFYSTYLGGNTADQGNAIALGPGNVAYITGFTGSSDFPFSTGAYPRVTSAHSLAFVTLIDSSQSGANSLKYSTVVGGTNSDTGYGIKADTLGNAYVAGGTQSPDFPVTRGAFIASLGVAPGDTHLFLS